MNYFDSRRESFSIANQLYHVLIYDGGLWALNDEISITIIYAT